MNPNIKLMPLIANYNIPLTSFDINNILEECEFICINNLKKNITNLPFNLKEIRLYKPSKKIKTKIPFGCKLYINDKEIKD